jgi:hypothetical protein
MAKAGYPGFELTVAARSRKMSKDAAIMLLRETQAEVRFVKKRAKEWRKGYERYEHIRTFTPYDFRNLWEQGLHGTGLDELVDISIARRAGLIKAKGSA